MPLVVRLVALFFVGFGLSFVDRSWAAEAEQQFDIPRQPLDAALEAFMQATGLQVLYKSTITKSHFSTAVRGRLVPSDALSRLLSGTNLFARFTTETAFTLFSNPRANPDAAQASFIATYIGFLGDAQRRIIHALCQRDATRPGGYRVALQFSISQLGEIDEPSLLDTSGDQMRDQYIVAALRRLPIGQTPPEGMPQPVTMLVMPRALGLPSDCQQASTK